VCQFRYALGRLDNHAVLRGDLQRYAVDDVCGCVDTAERHAGCAGID
jgi:hypothetical protein